MSTPPQRYPVVARTALPSRPAKAAPGTPPPVDTPSPAPAPPVTPAPAPDLSEGPHHPRVTPGPVPDGRDPLPDAAPVTGPSLSGGGVINLDTGEITDEPVADHEGTDDSFGPSPSGGDGEDSATGSGPSLAGNGPVVILDDDSDGHSEGAAAGIPASPVHTPAPVPVTPAVRPVGLPSKAPVRSPLPTAPPTPGRGGVSTDVDSWDLVPAPSVAKEADTVDVVEHPGEGDTPAGAKPRTKVVRLQPRDLLILQTLCRYRYMTYAQMAEKFQANPASLRRRMPKLEREGLVKSTRHGPSRFHLWRVTDDGADLAGLNLPAPKKIAWATIAHTLGLVDLAIAFEAAGELVLTEAEIRAADTRNLVSDRMAIARGQGHRQITNRPLFAIGAKAGGSANNLHVPDLVLAREEDPQYPGMPQSIAIELELKRKAPSRIRQTLVAYSKAPNIGMVVYYTHDEPVRDLIDQCAKDTGTTNDVQIRRWYPSFEAGLIEV